MSSGVVFILLMTTHYASSLTVALESIQQLNMKSCFDERLIASARNSSVAYKHLPATMRWCLVLTTNKKQDEIRVRNVSQYRSSLHVQWWPENYNDL